MMIERRVVTVQRRENSQNDPPANRKRPANSEK